MYVKMLPLASTKHSPWKGTKYYKCVSTSSTNEPEGSIGVVEAVRMRFVSAGG